MKVFALLKGNDNPDESPSLRVVFSTLTLATIEAERLKEADCQRHLEMFEHGSIVWHPGTLRGDMVYRHESFIKFEESDQEYADDVVVIREMEMDRVQG